MKVIKRYSRLPIVSFETDEGIGYDIMGRYRIMRMPFHYWCYCWFLKHSEGSYSFNDTAYFVTKYLLGGGTICCDEDVRKVIDRFNSLSSDSVYAQVSVDVVKDGIKWKMEDKRVLCDYKIIDGVGNEVVVPPNDITLEILR